MFSRIEVSIMRAFFWPVANLAYWGLVFFSWWDTRFRVFLGVSVLTQLSERRDWSYVIHHLGELESRVHIVLAESGVLPNEFLMIPLVMAVVLFLAPFIVRRDYGAPVIGFFVLPSMTLLCYLFAAILNVIVVAAMGAGIYFLMNKTPGADIFMFMVHPLYLIYPLFKSVPGLLSQCLYLVYVASILITPDAAAAMDGDYEDGEYEEDYPDAEDDWDKSACLMEMDRLTRIINSKFDTPSFIDSVRTDIAEYINRRAQIRNDVKLGMAHYKIVLTETKNSLRRILEADPKTARGAEAYGFVIDEMERMEYASPEDARTMRSMFLPEDAHEKHTEQVLDSPADPPAQEEQKHPAPDGAAPNTEQIINALIGLVAEYKTAQEQKTETAQIPEAERKTEAVRSADAKESEPEQEKSPVPGNAETEKNEDNEAELEQK